MVTGIFPGAFAMYVGKTLFAQLMDFLPWTTFARVVTHYGGITACAPCLAPNISVFWRLRN